jgi:hypothetical protein
MADLPTINSIYNSISKDTLGNNILRNKLINFVININTNEATWPAKGQWYKSIVENKNEFYTLRKLCFNEILDATYINDAQWISEQVEANEWLIQKERYKYSDYFASFKDASSVKKYFNIDHAIVSDYLILKKNGLVENKDIKKMIKMYKKEFTNNQVYIKIDNEKNKLRFPDEMNKQEQYNYSIGDDDENKYVNSFMLIYDSYPDDEIVEILFNEILKEKDNSIKYPLLDYFLASKNIPAEKVLKLKQQLAKNKAETADIYKTFCLNNKLQMLEDSFKVPAKIAQALLEKDGKNYKKYDTIYYLGQKINSYYPDKIFHFFNYKEKDEMNDQIAFVILPNDLTTIKKDEDFYEIHKTENQIDKTETFEQVSDNLIKKEIRKSILEKTSSYKNYGMEADEASLDLED